MEYPKNHKAMNADFEAARQYMPYILAGAKVARVAPGIFFAIGSRESNWGVCRTRLYRPNGPAGTGDWVARKGDMPADGLGWGRGLMQIDYAAHEFARNGNWQDPEANILYGASVLLASFKYLRRQFPSLSVPRIMRCAIAGYNCGPGNVKRALNAKKNPDHYTAHGNYSEDVLARARWFALYARMEAAA
ncbi:MAG: hypothetical protein AMXMBFR84_49560 [Candidatus Hydrogenedentota bacterium]